MGCPEAGTGNKGRDWLGARPIGEVPFSFNPGAFPKHREILAAI